MPLRAVRLAPLALALTGCVFAPIDLSPLPCPCGGGLVCDPVADRCVEPIDGGALDAGLHDRIRNGSFEDTAGGWPSPWVFEVRTPALATAMQIADAPAGGGAFSAEIDVTTAGDTPSDVQLRQNVGALERGDTIVLRFHARAEVARVIEVSVQEAGEPYTEYCAPSVSLGTAWDDYEYECVIASDAGPPGAEGVHVAFNGGGERGVFQLDAVELLGP